MYKRFLLIAIALLTAFSPVNAQRSFDEQTAVDNIRSALLRLPYYGVFDFLAFRYDKGTVTLSGYAYRPSLKKEATDAVRRLARVDQVVDEIEQLQNSPHDDSIRWAAFYRIYYDGSLSRYAPGAAFGGFNRRFETPRFPGMQPLGMYPIHIIVNRGRILLTGVVDSEADKTLVGIRAREVPGTFAVENTLEVKAP